MPNLLTRLSEWTNARRKLVWLVFFVLVVLIVAIVLTPVFLIMPFKAQTPRIVEISYLMRRWSPWLTLFASALMVLLAIRLWLGGRWWSRALLVLLLLPAFAATWLARQNHFEWMFNPLKQPEYVDAAKASFVHNDDIVMAVNIKGTAVAYPILQLGYHHIVNDVVSGEPIVATY